MEKNTAIQEREKMKKIPPGERIKSFKEIESCLSKKQALGEANRCLQCINPSCTNGCPAGVNCKEFIKKIREENFQGSLQAILEQNPLPCFTSRGCNSEAQCEGSCVLGKTGEPVSIRALERFVVENSELKNINSDTSKNSVAIIGAGPAGLAAAVEFRKIGINGKIFEKKSHLCGLAADAIPEYRIPKKVTDKQEAWMQKQGIEIEKGFKAGEKKTISEIMNEFDAVLIATGESCAKKLDVKGKELEGIYYWNNFLEEYCHGNGKKANGKKCVVVGGGDTAMDCARTALRMGFETTIAYRKNLEFMPCRKKEYAEALEEGIKFEYLLSPEEFSGEKKLEKIKFQKLEIKKEEFLPTGQAVEIEADLAILAIGQEFDETVFKGSMLQGKPPKEGISKTDLHGVFLAGDAINSQKTIVHAIQSAKNAVREIQQFIKDKKQKNGKEPEHGLQRTDVLLGA
ncbi:MAG: FAD-dependent oxidoreductase [Candidatus ainarchaeum sp.]|nr:FAD-dependent oxidoreductase [Candidatus ainarchaeum sp.]